MESNDTYINFNPNTEDPLVPLFDDNSINISASCTSIPASEIVSTGYEFANSEIIPNENISGSFFQSGSLIEFYVYDSQKSLISQDYNFTDWSITNNTSNPDVSTEFTNDAGLIESPDEINVIPTNEITISPTTDLYNRGFDNGEVFAFYNFINYELNSSIEKNYYISEISGDRTEIRLSSNTIPTTDIKQGFINLNSKLNSSEYFDEFYIGLFENNYVVAINIILDSDGDTPSVLIKLFDPLPQQYKVDDLSYVVTKVGESIAYKVEFIQDFSSFIDNANYIKGPNVNIPLQDLINNSTTLKSYDDLISTPSSKSLDNVLNHLNKTGVTITPNYSYNTFNEFINFSSAKQRINNFYEKVSQIQSYQSDINAIILTTGSNPNVTEISQSLASLQTNITNLVKNFDGYESYLYHESSSYAYPKTGSSYPYTLLATGSTEVLTWVGSDVENTQYYGGYKLSASLYDEDNQNWLYYTIPTFITENSDNDEYVEFSNMVGQSFDEVWLYTRALSERYNTTNDPESGLPLDLAAEAIKGLGFETFGNNYDNQDNFIGLTGEDNGIYVPPTGSELITDYIAVNNGQIINYWNLGYSWLNYVEQINEPGWPYAIDKVSKEIYKRLYHNMAYLTKKKGTISGLRQLINIWGVPNTILRINEFGGKNKDNSDDYDLWYKRYSYAYTPVASQYMASSSVKVPWMPLQRNKIADNEYIVPDGVAFRFKTTGHPSSSYGGKFYSQSLAVKKSNGTNDKQMDWGIGLFYEDQPSGSYSGSSFSDYYNYGKLRFYMSASTADGGVQISNDISLPFFDGGWWSVLLQRDTHTNDSADATTYTLFAANKQVDGWDGNSLGWSGSVSMSSANVAFNSGYGGGTYNSTIYDDPSASSPSINESWNRFGVSDIDGVYVGGYVSGSDVMSEVLNEGAKIFSGSFQEFRYYSNNISKETFNDFVMNPESVEGNNVTGSESSFDIVNFRAPLGNELEYKFTSSISQSFTTLISSSHPAITGSAPMIFTQSFIDPATSALTSSYDFIGYEAASIYTYSKPNVETYFLDQPAIGIRNRISNKIQVNDGEDYGTVLSKYRSIDQDYLISQSYTEDITSLEVGFSPQDEVNDDIIATYGYGVISDVLADPRFAYDSTESYYPKLRQIANEYFKKYTEGDVWDYLRLIKYFDNSLFKAIKSYVPARTSVTTGVIIKQHMLERNRRVPVKVNPNTIIAYTPETGSVVGGQSTAEGINSPISYRDLEITGSIDVATIGGGTGGVLDPYNVEVTQSAYFLFYSQTSPTNIPSQYTNLIRAGGVINSYGDIVDSNFGSGPTQGIRLKQPLKTRFKFFNSNTTNFLGYDEGFEFAVSSSKRGIIGTDIISSASLTPINTPASTSYYEMLPEEDISFWVKGLDLMSDPATPKSVNLSYIYFTPLASVAATNNDFIGSPTTPIPYSSSIWNSFNTQSYIVRNETISGSVYEIHKSQDEFYNGEFSGSEIIVTTQSLLDNPYTTAEINDISYKLAITSSKGQWSNSYGTPINTYPSFSFNLVVNQKEYGKLDELQDDFNNWEANNPNSTLTGSIFIQQSHLDNHNFWVVGLILPTLMDVLGNTAAQSYEPAGLLGYDDNNLLPLQAIPHPPVSASGMFGIQDGQIVPNDVGPYLKFDISGSINNTFFDPITGPVDFDQTGLLGNLDSNILISSFFGGNDIITKQVASTATAYGNIGSNAYGLTKYWFNNPSTNNARVIRLDQNIPQGGGYEDALTGPITVPIYMSNFDYISSEALGWIIKGSAPKPGSGSATFVGTTWTGSYGDFGNYAPIITAFNNISYDSDNNPVDNTDTLAFNEQFTYEIPNYTGTPTTEDIYGLVGNYFSQNLTVIDGKISFSNTSGVGQGWVYNQLQSRALSGSSTPIFTPTSNQGLQNITPSPQLPNLTIFNNSPFNPLINNITGSRANTYLQVAEFDGGSSTGSSGVPSNVIPIISGSAIKADIPDSFYTQKSSILPRYVGSTLQSANYNSYTPSGSEIAYLNGGVPGTLLSGSNQSLQTFVLCFTPGTQISLFNGSTKNIEDVVKGESIITYNELDNKNEEGIVGDVSSHEAESIIIITFNDGNIINTTEEHPFYVKEKGWVKASKIEVNDICQDIKGDDIIVSSITTEIKLTTVYYLSSVSNNHNYYANGILVHNKSSAPVVYTYAQSPVYGGDSLPGSMPSINVEVNTIAKHPIYFAHFRTSKQSNELWGSYTFNIDQLIECPLDSVQGEKAPENPVVIKVDGSGENLTEVRSTFEVDRKALVAYNQGKISKSGSSATINYTSLKVGESQIYQGSMEYQNIITNQIEKNNHATTQSFVSSSWSRMYGLAGTAINTITLPSSSYYLTASVLFSTVQSQSAFSLLTGSTDSSLYLMGASLIMSSSFGVSASVDLGTSICYAGRGLALVNTFNQYVSRSIYSTASISGVAVVLPGIPNNIKNTGGSADTIQLVKEPFFANPSNYVYEDFQLTTNNSDDNVTNFEDFQQPILFQVGDEIRVDYNSVGPNSIVGGLYTQTFTITDNGPNDEYENSIFPPDGYGDTMKSSMVSVRGPSLVRMTASAHTFDKVMVHPDPRTLDIPIPSGQIFNFTLRRRIEADDRVVIYQTAPTGSEGVKTLSPSGYLIPNDFSAQQKRNVQTIINQLSAKNAFRADEDNDTKKYPIE
jgi:hypothetical protein